jgi:four helix bundle protein
VNVPVPVPLPERRNNSPTGSIHDFMMQFDHERLDVYHRAIEFLDVVDEIVAAAPAGRAHLKDQIDRAATSVVLNIAEGAGEFSPRDKRRFYRMARRSATECAAVLDIFARRRHPLPDVIMKARALLLRVVSMLVRMADQKPGARTG